MEKDNIVHDFSGSSMKPNASGASSSKKPVVLFLILAILGIGTGYLLSQTRGGASLITNPALPLSKTGESGSKIYGSKDERAFKDSAEGTLREGGIDGEGAYHLERPGGESQNVYLTSSTMDLTQFLGKKVKVWGETHEAEKAGWLMDVGRLQVL